MVEADNKGLRYSEGKLRYDLFPPDAYEEIVKVYTEGARKYASRNWERGMDWSQCLRALKSHLNKWELGKTHDDELTECRHLAMVAWNAIALLTYELRDIGNNDIPEIYHPEASEKVEEKDMPERDLHQFTPIDESAPDLHQFTPIDESAYELGILKRCLRRDKSGAYYLSSHVNSFPRTLWVDATHRFTPDDYRSTTDSITIRT